MLVADGPVDQEVDGVGDGVLFDQRVIPPKRRQAGDPLEGGVRLRVGVQGVDEWLDDLALVDRRHRWTPLTARS